MVIHQPRQQRNFTLTMKEEVDIWHIFYDSCYARTLCIDVGAKREVDSVGDLPNFPRNKRRGT